MEYKFSNLEIIIKINILFIFLLEHAKLRMTALVYVRKTFPHVTHDRGQSHVKWNHPFFLIISLPSIPRIRSGNVDFNRSMICVTKLELCIYHHLKMDSELNLCLNMDFLLVPDSISENNFLGNYNEEYTYISMYMVHSKLAEKEEIL